MKLVLATCFSLLFPVLATAQNQAIPQNPNTFGRWDIETESGMRGSVVIQRGICHYSLISSFSSIQSTCSTIWYEDTNTLMILPRADTRTGFARPFTVPDYQPGPNNYNTTDTIRSLGETVFTFEMTTFGKGWMKGHLLGSSTHDTVTLRQH